MNKIRELISTYRGFLAYLKPDLSSILLDYFTIIIAVVTNAAMIWLIGKPFNLLQQEKYEEVFAALFLFGLVVVINQLAQFAGGLLTNKIGLNTIGRIRTELLNRLLVLSFPVAGQVSKGDLIARLTNDIDRIKTSVVDGLLFSLSHLLTLVIYIVMLFYIDTRLALIALAITPVFLIHQRIFSPLRQRATQKFLDRNGQLIAFEDESLANMRGISAFNAEGTVTALHQKVFSKARHWALRERGLDVGFGISFTLLMYLTGLVLVLLGIDGVREGRFGIGHLLSFLLYLGYLTMPARGFAEIFFQLIGNQGAAKRVLEVFETKSNVPEQVDAKPLVVTDGKLVFENVSFAYDENHQILSNVSLEIQPGQSVAIVGPSGGGKSTLANLLLRFYDLNKGSLLVDGQDVRGVTLKSLRENVGIVWQEAFLVSDTIRANFALVKPGIEESEIIHACEAAAAWEFIEKLDYKLDTIIGAGGVTLSLGQKQRIALAQVFVHNPPILILDEATSALDSITEQKVVDSIGTWRKDKTTLLIAHRYSAIKTVDSVIYLPGDGSVIFGSHEELMQKLPDYQNSILLQQ